MADLALPANWTRFTDDELRDFIRTTEGALRGGHFSGASTHGYLMRLYRARLVVLRREQDRRIARASQSGVPRQSGAG